MIITNQCDGLNYMVITRPQSINKVSIDLKLIDFESLAKWVKDHCIDYYSIYYGVEDRLETIFKVENIRYDEILMIMDMLCDLDDQIRLLSNIQ